MNGENRNGYHTDGQHAEQGDSGDHTFSIKQELSSRRNSPFSGSPISGSSIAIPVRKQILYSSRMVADLPALGFGESVCI